MRSVRDLIEKWPSASEFARDLGLKREGHGVTMRMRGSIPVAYWEKVVTAAASRGIDGISYETLVSAHAPPPPPAPSETRETA